MVGPVATPMNTSPITARDRELMAMPTMADQLPVAFEDGTCWHRICGSCNGCGCPIPEADTHGALWRPLPHVVELDCVGICRACRLLTRFRLRLHPGRRLSWLTAGGWMDAQAPMPWRARLRGLAKAILRFFPQRHPPKDQP